MTLRAFILGTLGAILIAGLGYLNDTVARLNFLVGNHLPILVFGGLIVFSLMINPLLSRTHPKAALSPAEMAIITALALVACAIPGSGLMRKFSQTIALPSYYHRQEPGWARSKVLDYAPQQLILRDPADETAITEFVTGHREKKSDSASAEAGPPRLLNPAAVPWSHWMGPLSWWLPIILLTGVAVTCLSLIVHEQWSKRENLRYPIASVASAIITGQVPGCAKPLRADRLFWIGLVIVFAVRVINGIDIWYPGYFIKIPLDFDFSPLLKMWPSSQGIQFRESPFILRIFPTVIAFAFFLASDVALTLGLTQYGMVALMTVLTVQGVDLGGDVFSGTSLISWQMFGSGLGMGLIILYLGRNYYGNLLARCFTHLGGDYAVWALRVLFVSGVALAGILMWLGLDWPMAFLTVALVLLAFTVTARISAESGLFHIEANWNALGVLAGLFGLSAMGPKAMVAVGLIAVMLTSDYRECLMPFLTNALKICDTSLVRPAKAGWTGMGVYAIALAVAVPVVLMANYSRGVPQSDGWGFRNVPKLPFDFTLDKTTTLQNADQLEFSKNLSSVERLTHMSPQPRFLWAAGLGLLGVLVFSKLRLQWNWWPLHPIFFLVWGTWPITQFNTCFLMGWLIKSAVRRFGTAGLYTRLKPLMIGLIAGDLLGGLLFMCIGAAYYLVKGISPPSYWIFLP
ncbi:MAG: hypothetical protein NTV86_15585 [Planctomycetota bacterium]|nr:hypothetical protein [Planctomycetota bacterium]